MSNLLKKAAIAVTVAGFALTAQSFAATSHAMTQKLGVVNYLQVFQAAPQGKATLTKLKSALKPQVAGLQSKQKKLAADIKKLERNGPTMTKKARLAKEKVITAEQQQFQAEVMKLRADEMKKEQSAAASFEKSLKTAIDTVGKKGHYTMLFNQQAVPYSSGSDVTKQVIAAMKG